MSWEGERDKICSTVRSGKVRKGRGDEGETKWKDQVREGEQNGEVREEIRRETIVKRSGQVRSGKEEERRRGRNKRKG